MTKEAQEYKKGKINNYILDIHISHRLMRTYWINSRAENCDEGNLEKLKKAIDLAIHILDIFEVVSYEYEEYQNDLTYHGEKEDLELKDRYDKCKNVVFIVEEYINNELVKLKA